MGLRWFDFVTAAGVGALSLIDPARLRPGQRAAYRGTLAVLAGALTWDALSAAPASPGAAVAGSTHLGADDEEAQFGPYGEFGAHTSFPETKVRRRRGNAAQRQVRAAYTVGTVGLALGLAGPSEAVDDLVQRWLVRSGVRRPRAVMAAAAVLVSLASAAAARRGPVAPA